MRDSSASLSCDLLPPACLLPGRGETTAGQVPDGLFCHTLRNAIDCGSETELLIDKGKVADVAELEEDAAFVAGVFFNDDLGDLDVGVLLGDEVGGVVAGVVVVGDVDKGIDVVVRSRTRRQVGIEEVVAGGECRQRQSTVVGLPHHGAGVVVNPIAHLEVVGTASAAVLDDEGDADVVERRGIDDDGGGLQIGDGGDALDASEDGVIVDVVVFPCVPAIHKPLSERVILPST